VRGLDHGSEVTTAWAPAEELCFSESTQNDFVVRFSKVAGLYLKVPATENRKLLEAYARDGCESAFATVLERYVGFVYGTALRLLSGDSQLAEDVTQIVFCDLARAANRMKGGVMLGGWLHQHTCFVAAKTIRAERRRRAREEKAAMMKLENPESEMDIPALARALDEAMNRLGAADRAAIVMRYFEGHDFGRLGQALGSSEAAARMRVNRALEKLRAILTKRGFKLSGAGLATALALNASAAAPAGLATSIAGAATAALGAGGGIICGFETFQILLMTKLKIIAAVCVAVGAVTPLILQHRENARLRAELESMRAQLPNIETAAASASAAPPMDADELRRLRDEQQELMRLRAQASAYRESQRALTNAQLEVARLETAMKAAQSRRGSAEPRALAAGLRPVRELQNLGHATPSSAFETVIWANSVNDMRQIARSLTFDEESRPKAEQVLANASQAVRQEFPTIEDMVAKMMTKTTRVDGMRVLQEEEIAPGESRVITEWQFADGRVQPESWRFRRAADGAWQMVIEARMAEKLGRMVTEYAAQLQAAAK
jgi:RNA polymerase sigma factor (sigma-70 family)